VGFEEGDHYTFAPHLVYRRDAPLGRGGRLFLELLDEELSHQAPVKNRRRDE
jgi:hypothetical protein